MFHWMAEPQTDDPALEQLDFDVNGIDCEVARATMRQLLQDLNGVCDVLFLDGAATVTYNPVGVTKEEVCSAIRDMGYHATEIEVTV